jgi:SAM-dependent methyltransferase
MPLATTPSGIFEWITSGHRPRGSDAATLRFERMESQSAYRLPEVHKPLNHHDPSHWHHRGMIWDFVLAMGDAERVLDVGPGDGWPSLLIAPHFKEVVGIEPGERRVAACKANAQRLRLRKARFEQMSAVKMTFPAGSFDGVVAATSFEQTPDPAAALTETYRVLRPGGVLRMVYEPVEAAPEPVRETIMVQRGEAEGTFLIDYVVTWARRLVERNFLIAVRPASEASRRHLELWAQRCETDAYPLRDPRLERGLVRAIRSIRKPEVESVQSYGIRHFRTDRLVQLLAKIGFTEVRCIVGGGAPAAQCGLEMIQSRRIEAAAPLMEEICRAAARFGLTIETTRPGNVVARKPRGRGTSAVRPKKAARRRVA